MSIKANTSDFLLPCVVTHRDNESSKTIFQSRYIPDFMEITFVVPVSRHPREPNAFCKWLVYMKDAHNRGPSMELYNNLHRFLNVYKPRNTVSAHVEFHGVFASGSIWSVEYDLFWCTCGSQSVFVKPEPKSEAHSGKTFNFSSAKEEPKGHNTNSRYDPMSVFVKTEPGGGECSSKLVNFPTVNEQSVFVKTEPKSEDQSSGTFNFSAVKEEPGSNSQNSKYSFYNLF